MPWKAYRFFSRHFSVEIVCNTFYHRVIHHVQTMENFPVSSTFCWYWFLIETTNPDGRIRFLNQKIWTMQSKFFNTRVGATTILKGATSVPFYRTTLHTTVKMLIDFSLAYSYTLFFKTPANSTPYDCRHTGTVMNRKYTSSYSLPRCLSETSYLVTTYFQDIASAYVLLIRYRCCATSRTACWFFFRETCITKITFLQDYNLYTVLDFLLTK
jgi:hypothetical protein